MKKDSGGTNEYNECFNTIQLKETNRLRYEHIADSVKIDDLLAGFLNKELAAVPEADLPKVLKCWSICAGAVPDATLCATGKDCDPAKTGYTYTEATHTCKKDTIAITTY